MGSQNTNEPDAVCQAYLVWRRRVLASALVASVVAVVIHGPTGELTLHLDGEWLTPWRVIGLVALIGFAFGPQIVAAVVALAAVISWRKLHRSNRLARWSWIAWVIGPLPVLLLPLAALFDLNEADALRTSATQVKHLLLVTAPALFAVLPGILRAALVLKRFLPESRAPGQIAGLSAWACLIANLIPLGVVAQLAFEPRLYLGLFLISLSPVVPLVCARRLLRRDDPTSATRLIRVLSTIQGLLTASGATLLVLFVGEHPVLRDLLGRVDPMWVLALVARVLAGKWLMTVVVTDLLLLLLHTGHESSRALAGTPEGERLVQKLDAMGKLLAKGER